MEKLPNLFHIAGLGDASFDLWKIYLGYLGNWVLLVFSSEKEHETQHLNLCMYTLDWVGFDLIWFRLGSFSFWFWFWFDGWMDGWMDRCVYIIYIYICVLHRFWLYHTSASCMAQELGHLYVHDFTLHRVSCRFVLIWVCLKIGYPQIPLVYHHFHPCPPFRWPPWASTHFQTHLCTYIYIIYIYYIYIWTYLKLRTWACPNLLLLAAGRT